MERIDLFIDVLLPLPLPGYFTYRVPQEFNAHLQIGQRVAVPFGKHKIYGALVCAIHEQAPKEYVAKYFMDVLDEQPIVNEMQLHFWHWLSDYYMCTMGEIMSAALPSGFKLTNDTRIVLNPYFDGDVSGLNEKEIQIIQALQVRPELNMNEIAQISGQIKTLPLTKSLRERGIILVKEEIGERYKPKQETYVCWGDAYIENETAQKTIFENAEKKAFKQLEILMAYLRESTKIGGNTWVKRSEVLRDIVGGAAALQTLVKKNVFKQKEEFQSRLQTYENTAIPAQIELSDAQNKAYTEIHRAFIDKDVCLLHGVTSSGKTEIYIKLIEQALKQGKQVLYLLPEIALTSQIIERLRKYFGSQVGIYHSRHNEHEKIEIWNHTQDTYRIILGARSAIFLPFSDLGLVIVDEEHDSSFKQQDPAPRYNARDAAIYLASLHKAKTLLGSATPSIESYYNALHDKYGLVNLYTRYGDVHLPTIWVADLKKESKNKSMHGHFSSFLITKIEAALEKKEQVILFQNRRGFSPRLECELCHHTPTCKNCDVTLTYHKAQNQLRCHYCGYSIPVPTHCPECGKDALKIKGFGTEKIEEDLALMLPNIRIARMDLDTTRSKNAYIELIHAFQERKIDVLVGTQMVTKGLDFDNVSVVGILNADNMISFPDFRAYERSFQLMTQVSGRAGRKNGKGDVIIQSYNPYFQVIQDVINNDYMSMYQSQIHERQIFKYPPYYRLLKLSLKHKEEELLQHAAQELAQGMRQVFGGRVLGPEYPMVSRVQGLYIKNILLKIERPANINQAKERLQQLIHDFWTRKEYKSIWITIDVDPQ
ncbi:MAG: primosomal protein N' [Bacteroidales bacterium]